MGEAAPINSCSPQLYRPRDPKNSQYYQCVEDHFETLTAVICTMVSLVSNVLTAGMNICWLFPASAATSALPAIKSGWSSLVNGSVWRF